MLNETNMYINNDFNDEQDLGPEIPKMSGVNIVQISGKIINKYETGKITKITIKNSETKPNRTYTNFPIIYFFKDKNGQSIVDQYRVNDFIKTTAYIASDSEVSKQLQKNPETKNVIYRDQLVGTDISPIDSFYPNQVGDIKGNQVPIIQNNFCVQGTITHIERIASDIVYIYVDIIKNGHENTIRLVRFSKKYEGYPIGARIKAYGKISTKRKEIKNRKAHFYQSNVIAKFEIIS